MTNILVATDFSARSDRALRRAVLLAKAGKAGITLIHVIDDDQPRGLIRKKREAADQILNDQARTLRAVDGVDCEVRIVEGDPFEGIGRTAGEIAPDLVVIGPHRRQLLKDVFMGTTAERTIRASRNPILMANGVPAGQYRHVLVAVDFSECSAQAVRTVARLGLDRSARVSVVHVHDAPARPMMRRASISSGQIEDYLSEEEKEASGDLSEFLAKLEFEPAERLVKLDTGSVANVVEMSARDISADLIVVGTHGQGGARKFFLGSVAGEILRTAQCDVLAVPPSNAAVS